MTYIISEVDGSDPDVAETLHRFNRLDPVTFPELKPRHLEEGFWWLAYFGAEPVAFAGVVPNYPYDRAGVGYLKRAYVLPDHRGHGLQLLLMETRILKARQLGWSMLVSECGPNNGPSAANFARAGFERTDPEQPWARADDLYWAKRL